MPTSDYTPSVASVGTRLRSRTKTRGGAEAGTFNPADQIGTQNETRPTAEQAQLEIDDAIEYMSSIIGTDIPATAFSLATSAARIRSAMNIELGYWPEQVNTGRSIYPQLLAEWKEVWGNLMGILGITPDAGGGSLSADAGFPSGGGWPCTAIGMEHPW